MLRVPTLIEYVVNEFEGMLQAADTPLRAALHVQRDARDRPEIMGELLGPTNHERRRLQGLLNSFGNPQRHCWWLQSNSYKEYLRNQDKLYRRENDG